MKKVTQKEFYELIGHGDICVTSRGYDHSRFETRERREVGRAYAEWKDTKNGSEYITTYYIAEWFLDSIERGEI